MDVYISSEYSSYGTLNGVNIGGQTSFVISNAGQYTFVAYDYITGCSTDTTVAITVPDPLQAQFIIENEQYNPNSASSQLGSIEVSIQGGTTPYLTYYNGYLSQNPYLIEYLYSGNYDIIIRDNNGCEYSESVYVGLSTDLNEHNSEEISVDPNPFTNFIKIELKGLSDVNIQLIDSKGAIVKQTIANMEQIIMNTNDLTDGIYTIMIFKDNKLIYEESLIRK